MRFRRPSTTAFIERIARQEIATGVSSRAMVQKVLWGKDLGCAMPYDSGDWNRCLKTYLAAPPHLQRRMKPIMDLYYERLTAYDTETGHAEWRMKGVVWT